MTQFIEERIAVDMATGMQAMPRFMTTIKRLRGGAEYRNANWAQPLREYEVQYNARSRGRVESELVDLVMRTRGALVGFRVRDWSDYQATDENLGVGDGSVFYMPFVKNYGTFSRRIYKPDPDTVTIKFNGVILNSNRWFTDMKNGVVVFIEPVPSGVTVSWSGEFDVPCRFEDDAMSIIMHTDQVASVASISLLEERVRDNVDPAEYDEIRELLAKYPRDELLAFYDVLDVHMNVKWRDTA